MQVKSDRKCLIINQLIESGITNIFLTQKSFKTITIFHKPHSLKFAETFFIIMLLDIM